MERYCFVIMPFAKPFDGVHAIIRSAAQQNGLTTLRADEIQRAGFVMDQIREHIQKAVVVIADLTGRNANVFYETAIAHLTKDPHQVVLIAQTDDDVPFDLRPRRYLRYENTAGGGQDLERGLAAFIGEAISGDSGQLNESIVGREERTRRIVADCEALLRTGDQSISSLRIRFGGGLSPLSISPAEVYTEPYNVYGGLLQQERERTAELIRRGARLKAILAPRVTMGALTDRMSGTRFKLRFEQLIGSLIVPAMLPPDRVEIALTEPYYVGNSFILGTQVLYDGIKASMGGGFDLTFRLTDKSQIAARTRAFDSLFEDAAAYTLKMYGGGKSPSDLRAACIRGLEQLYDDFRKRF
jgi:hypothetical protein